jgi:hypothetical protein
MLTFFEYVMNRDFHESVDPDDAQRRFECERNLQDLFLWYSGNLSKKEEFYKRLENNIRDCFSNSLLLYQRRMVRSRIVDEEEVINRTLIGVHNTVEKKIRNRELNYNRVGGLITNMIRASVVDIIRRNNWKSEKGNVRFNTVGTIHEPSSFADDPSSEKLGLNDVLSVPNLSPRQKIILTRRSEGIKNQDIAAELNVVPSYTTQLYNDAKKKIRAHYGIDAYTGNSEELY